MYAKGVRHILIADDNITLDVPRSRSCAMPSLGLKRSKLQFVIQASSAGIAKDPALPRRMADDNVTRSSLASRTAARTTSSR